MSSAAPPAEFAPAQKWRPGPVIALGWAAHTLAVAGGCLQPVGRAWVRHHIAAPVEVEWT